ncbi:hypothetical protein [Streptomyces mobaraensis]|uniref:Uncharacterized protein n=1 Tax=Streptomyces mobaraensis TaxID=35621 RepID=A0A5N5W303_STRMB|nr:hypothetical protein [Streptomyces mobaraensis]KAB7835743.1 hypothetical protein FRZ00_26345 [Streptomyces mobaraensis]
MAETTSSADPAVHFPDPDTAYDALLEWRRDRERSNARRAPLVLGALRTFKEAGHPTGESLVHRASGLSRTTIGRIVAGNGGLDGPAVTQEQFPNLELYAEVLAIRADRLADAPPGEAETPEAYDHRYTLRRELERLAGQVREADEGGLDIDHQALTADLRCEVAALRSGVIDTYDGPLRETEQHQRLNEAVADCLQEVIDQVTQFRLRGDKAAEDLDAELVAEARRRIEGQTAASRVALTGSERYAQAMVEGRTVTGSSEGDLAATAALVAARRMTELQKEMGHIRAELLRPADDSALDDEDAPASPEDMEAAADAQQRQEALRYAAQADPEVRQALVAVLGEEQATALLTREDLG